MTELPLPSIPEVERLTLGALMTDPDAIDQALDNLTADDFAEERHRRIYLRIAELRKDGEPVDRVTLAHYLRHAGQLESVGGLTYLVSLDQDLPHLANIGAYIGLLRDKAIARRVILLANDVETRARAGEDANHLIESLRSMGDALAVKNQQSFETFEQIITRVGVQQFLKPSGANSGIIPPLPALAERFRLTRKSQTVIAGSTGGGKTALAGQFVWAAALQGKRTAWYSLEMENEENARRLVGQIGQVNMHRIRMGGGTFSEEQAALEAIAKIADVGDLILFRATPIDLQMVNSDLQKLKMAGTPADLGVIDHIQIVETPGKSENRTQEISALSRGFLSIWSRHSMAGLVLCQLNGGDEYEEPTKRRLMNQGSISHDAAHVIFTWPHSAADYEEPIRKWHGKLDKNRHGPTGKFDMEFVRKYACFTQIGG